MLVRQTEGADAGWEDWDSEDDEAPTAAARIGDGLEPDVGFAEEAWDSEED